jgi:hypothetical protein
MRIDTRRDVRPHPQREGGYFGGILALAVLAAVLWLAFGEKQYALYGCMGVQCFTGRDKDVDYTMLDWRTCASAAKQVNDMFKGGFGIRYECRVHLPVFGWIKVPE